jgi:peroxiredoxin
MTHVPDQLSPDLTVLDTSGQTVRLRDLAAGKALVIVFIRHFG